MTPEQIMQSAGIEVPEGETTVYPNAEWAVVVMSALNAHGWEVAPKGTTEALEGAATLAARLRKALQAIANRCPVAWVADIAREALAGQPAPLTAEEALTQSSYRLGAEEMRERAAQRAYNLLKASEGRCAVRAAIRNLSTERE